MLMAPLDDYSWNRITLLVQLNNPGPIANGVLML